MEGKSFYGKTTSPKVIAEASLAYSFSFDLQRFTDYVWSIGSDANAGKYIYGAGTTSIASLQLNNSTWSLAGGTNNTPIVLNFNDTANKSASGSVTGGDILTSIGTSTTFDAKSVTGVFNFKLKSNANTSLTSIAGGMGGNSLDASGVTSPSNGLWLVGGNGVDSIIAGSSGKFYLNGNGGDDSLVGGNGTDYFIYGGSGKVSISGYGSGDIVSLSAFPGVASVTTYSSDYLALGFGNSNNSLIFADTNSKDSIFKITDGTSTYYYNKDYIQSAPSTSTATFSLTSAASSLDASSYSAVSIDGTAANDNSGLKVTLTSGADSIIGSASKANTIFGGGGNDFVSLKGGTSADVFVYNGSGDASIKGLGTSGYVSLSAKKAAHITDGNSLESLACSEAGKSSFRLKFGTSNTLTFIDSASASIKVGDDTDTRVYTPTAISIAGAANAGDSVTLGTFYKEETFGTGSSSFTWIDASAVASNMSAFAIAGSTTGGNRLIGSDNIITSIKGGDGNDTIYAGKAGASLNGNDGADLLIGNTSGEDTFIYTGNGNATIRNYTYDADLVSLGGNALPTTDVNKFKLESGTSTFRISLGASGDSVLTFMGANTVEAVSLGTSNSLDTYHYEHDRVIVNKSRVTLGTEYTSKNFNVNASTFTDNSYALSSIDASHVTVKNGINITAYANSSSTTNSVIGAQFGGRIIGSEYGDYLKSGVSLAAESGGSLYSSTIDAGAVVSNDKTDTLVGGEGKDWFIYRGGTASIGSYTKGYDTITVLSGNDGFTMIGEDAPTFASLGTSKDLVLDFGSGASLSIAGGASSGNVVTFRNGSHTLEYGAGAVSIDSKSVILTKDYDASKPYITEDSITTVNASDVTTASGVRVALGVNTTLGTRLIGSESYANSLRGGDKNDYLTGGNAADVFVYTGGKDTVSNYSFSQADSLVADTFIGSIKSGKVSGSRLIFTGNKKGDVLTFLSDDDAIEKVSVNGSGYLTKDGHVQSISSSSSGDYSFELFSSARGRIDLNVSPYTVSSGITSVNAAAVAQGITLAPVNNEDKQSTYILPDNKRKDRFEYAGGKVSISGYESGKDQLNLGIGTVSGFEIKDSDVVISLSGSANNNNIVSISGGADMDFLIHQSTDGTSTYRKMAFNQSGVLTNKASKPTSVTVFSGADSLNANDLGNGTIKKIYAAAGLSSISIEAGDKNNTTIDISAAGAGMSVYGGKKNDKITGSNTEGDLFVYRTNSGVGGRDVITNFDYNNDMVSLGANPEDSLSSAKITKGSKSVTFKFKNSKNSLNLKSADAITEVTVASGDTNSRYTFGKNAFSKDDGATVSLTSNFSGNFDTSRTTIGDATATSIDGSQVTKAFTFKGTSSGETVSGGTTKTTFRGGGGADKLIGGSGKDIFFYAKGDAGNTEIADFDYKNDKIKIASGTLKEISTIEGGGIQLAMKDNSGNSIGFYQITSAKNYKSDTAASKPGASTVFKANNTYYWFAPGEVKEEVTVSGSDGTTETVVASAGQLVTTNNRVSASKVSDYDVIELNYTTNLVKAGVAVASANAKLPNE